MSDLQNTNIGPDVDNSLLTNIVNASQSGYVDLSSIEGFTQLSQQRDEQYRLLDSMAEDSTIAAVLETYAEDATEYNDEGDIVWATSDDDKVLKQVNYLLTTLQIDKNIYSWVRSLCNYGDLYLKLYRQSTVDSDVINPKTGERKHLNEAIKIKAYSKDDKLVHYIDQVPNPAGMFELVKYGKTISFIEAPSSTLTKNTNNSLINFTYSYKFSTQDITIYPATEYVHASLEDGSNRIPEEVTLFKNSEALNNDEDGITYTVRRGVPLLQKAFKIWRQLMLLENSLLLNRITKSAVVRVVNVEVGDMPKENVGPHIHGIKTMFEQKAALNSTTGMSEYTNPGPMENTIYVPTHGGVGSLSTQQIGGDVDVKSIVDIDYFKDKLYSAVRIPKQFLGDTSEPGGFNGGTSLSLVSSRYAKLVKRIQNTMIQALTTCINIFLLDAGYDSYVNKFQLHLTAPSTQEETDRQETISTRVDIATNILNLCSDITDPENKLLITKALLSNIVSDEDIMAAFDHEMKLQAMLKETESIQSTEEVQELDQPYNLPAEESSELEGSSEITAEDSEELPNMNALGIDFADNTEEI